MKNTLEQMSEHEIRAPKTKLNVSLTTPCKRDSIAPLANI
jgi:hypothetical protein